MIRVLRRAVVEVLSLLLWRWTYPIPAGVDSLAQVTALPLPPQTHYTPEPFEETAEGLAAAQDEAIRIADTGFECFDPTCDMCKGDGATQDRLIAAVNKELRLIRGGKQ